MICGQTSEEAEPTKTHTQNSTRISEKLQLVHTTAPSTQARLHAVLNLTDRNGIHVRLYNHAAIVLEVAPFTNQLHSQCLPGVKECFLFDMF